MRTLTRSLPAALLLAGLLMPARAQTPESAPITVRAAVDRIIQQEAKTVQLLRQYTPRFETYIQETRADQELGSVPIKDHYYLGKVDFRGVLDDRLFTAPPSAWKQLVNGLSRDFTAGFTLSPEGFAAMMAPDPTRFDRKHYHFEYVREEFLGSVRCLVFDVTPLADAGRGTFMGRIWAEDQGYNIVRFNGTFIHAHLLDKYFHFDTWRVNVRPGVWLPAYIFSDDNIHSGIPPIAHHLRFRAESRLWGYDLKTAQHEQESTELVIQNSAAQNQATDVDDYSPVESQRLFQRDAENNYLDRLQKAGLLAPPGPVDKILETVVNNVEVTNNLNIDPPVRCRVLLTSPLEVFAVGHTIVISRGLIDVLPDEASLAMVLSHGLARIALGYQLDMSFGFDDRLIFPDIQSLKRLKILLNAKDEEAIDAKAVQLLQNSPYKGKLAQAGLFLAGAGRGRRQTAQPDRRAARQSAGMGRTRAPHDRADEPVARAAAAEREADRRTAAGRAHQNQPLERRHHHDEDAAGGADFGARKDALRGDSAPPLSDPGGPTATGTGPDAAGAAGKLRSDPGDGGPGPGSSLTPGGGRPPCAGRLSRLSLLSSPPASTVSCYSVRHDSPWTDPGLFVLSAGPSRQRSGNWLGLHFGRPHRGARSRALRFPHSGQE